MVQRYDYHSSGPYSKRKRTHGQGLQGVVLTVDRGLTLPYINNRLSFQKGAPLQGRVLLALDLAVSAILSPALIYATQPKGKHDSGGSARLSPAKPYAATLGPLACTLPSAASAKWSWYKLCITHPEE